MELPVQAGKELLGHDADAQKVKEDCQSAG
jgi:hypothetical protein